MSLPLESKIFRSWTVGKEQKNYLRLQLKKLLFKEFPSWPTATFIFL
jgi:hypothetical protein